MVESGNIESVFANHKPQAPSPLPTEDMLLKVDQLNDEIKLLLEKYSTDNIASAGTRPALSASKQPLEHFAHIESLDHGQFDVRYKPGQSDGVDDPRTRRHDDSCEFENLDDIYGHPGDLKNMFDVSMGFAHSPAKIDFDNSAIKQDHESPLETSHHPVLHLLQSKTDDKYEAFESSKKNILGKYFDLDPRQPLGDQSLPFGNAEEDGGEESEEKKALDDASFLSKMKKLLSDTRKDIDLLDESFVKPLPSPNTDAPRPAVSGKPTPTFTPLASSQTPAARLPQAINVKSVLTSKHKPEWPKPAASSRLEPQQPTGPASYYDKLPASRATRPAMATSSHAEEDEESFCLRKHIK